jgi:hypothetical protein
MDVGGCSNGVSVYEGALCGGRLGRAPLMGARKDILH